MMKFLITHLLFLFIPSYSVGQAGQWVWVRGDTLFNLEGNWIDPENQDSSYYPPALYLASSWEDDSGRLWLFGGSMYDQLNHDDSYDHIWRYDPQSDFWDWVKGTHTVDGSGTYGIQGVAHINNNPGGRKGAMIWKDHNNVIWMFGGENSIFKAYNDLWKYDMTTNLWTWVKGPNEWDQNGKYGTKGVPAPTNLPPVRANAAVWVDTNNDLWMFGGHHTDDLAGEEFYNDVWRYNIDSNVWTWIGGPKQVNQPAVYGTKGIPDIDNIPCARSCRVYWSDSNDFYLFGGDSIFSLAFLYGDVWKFNANTLEWTWKHGTNEFNEAGVPGNFCEFDSSNYPSTRAQASCNKITDHSILLFGGFLKWENSSAGISRETWMYDFIANEWTRIWGDSTTFDGNFGIQGVYHPDNDPRSRLGHVSWNGIDNSVWMYGGTRCIHDCSANDLWKYTLDPACGGIPTTINTTPNNSNELHISPNPSSSSINIEYSITQPSTLTITDAYGRVVKQLTLYFKNRIVYLEGLAQGVYLVTVEGDGKRWSEKLVVQ